MTSKIDFLELVLRVKLMQKVKLHFIYTWLESVAVYFEYTIRIIYM